MKRIMLLMLLVVWTATVAGQVTRLTLQKCYQLALQNHPLSAQNALFQKSSLLQQKIWDENNLPQLNLNGQATYQSAVTELPLKIPGISLPDIPKEQFRVSLDANQVIYGGGVTNNQKLVEQSSLEINKKSTESELYRLRERINQVFFNIILANFTLDVLKLNREELYSRFKKMEAGVNSGAMLPFNATILKAEILKVDQKQIEAQSQKAALISLLGVLTGIDIPANTTFDEPEIGHEPGLYRNLRPEYSLFDLQLQKVNALKNLTVVKRNPKAYAFGNLGYGRPGLNMFKEEADLFYIVGAKVSWNIWNWNQTRKEIQLLDINKEILENQKKTFDLNTKASIQQFIADILKINELLNTDEEIIALRVEITASAASQLENGIITVTEYLTEYNAEIQARLSKRLHQVQLLQAKAAYQGAIGIL